MPVDYVARLRLPVVPEPRNRVRFWTRSGLLLATGYHRIVIGGRGPYIEFTAGMVDPLAIAPVDVPHRYYSDVPGRWYVNPLDVLVDGRAVMDPLPKPVKAQLELGVAR